MKTTFKKLIPLVLVCFTAACANYELGSISKRYCNETDPVVKAALKAQITKFTGELPVDYCLTKLVILGE